MDELGLSDAPDASWSNQPRSARRFAFERTPSTFAATAVSMPITAAMSLAHKGSRPGRSCSTFKIR
ncbi:hypothetical protein [Streptomyces sp. NPDC058394]|uniref:hypothetical protein n=1 Tax=unclassified Streptomyces TaxID=2593676 RepID=UPI003659419B